MRLNGRFLIDATAEPDPLLSFGTLKIKGRKQMESRQSDLTASTKLVFVGHQKALLLKRGCTM